MFKNINRDEFFKCLAFLLGFMAVLFVNLSANSMEDYDKLWTFHMTQKVSMGEVPYKDINIIITPLFYQMGALLFKVFGRADFMVYSIYGAFIGGGLGLLAYKLIREVAEKETESFVTTLYMLSIFLPLLLTSYNTLLLVFMLWSMYLELRKEKSEEKSKYNLMLGIVLGLCAATKHSVGGVVILMSIAVSILKKTIFKEKCLKEILLKLAGVSIVGSIYLIWLIITGAFLDFVDLAILGLLEFAEKNTGGNLFNAITAVNILTIFSMFMLVKYLNNKVARKKIIIIVLYVIASCFYAIPLVNYYHVAFSGMFAVLIIMCATIKLFKNSPKIRMLSIILIEMLMIGVSNLAYFQLVGNAENISNRWIALKSIWQVVNVLFTIATVFLILFDKYKSALIMIVASFCVPIIANSYIWATNVKENSKIYIPEYSCLGVTESEKEDVQKVIEFIKEKEAEGYNVLILDIIASKYMIPMHRNNNKFDLILNGNLGYNGEAKLIEEIESIKNILILRQKPEVETIEIQQPQNIDDYIEKNYELNGEICNLEIYN